MEFTFQSEYDTKALTALARTMRKTLRKKHSRISHIFAVVIIVLALLVVVPFGDKIFVWNTITFLDLVVAVALTATLLFEDRLNGYIARKRLMPGTENNTAVFGENSFTTVCEVGTTEWNYENVLLVAETSNYFVFLYSKNHGQIYTKASMTGGTLDEFRTFIEEKVGKKIQKF